MKQDKILKERLKKKYDAGFTTNVEFTIKTSFT